MTCIIYLCSLLVGGDIFIHAKSNDTSKLFELCQRVMAQLPPDSVESFEDIYSFVYKNGRDLSGFIDGTCELVLLLVNIIEEDVKFSEF